MSALRKLARGEKSQMEEKWLQHNEKEQEMRVTEKTQRHVVKSHFAQDKHKDKDGPMSPEIKNIMTNHGNDICPMAKKILAGKFPTPGTGRVPTQWEALDHLVHCHLSAMRTNDVSSTWMDEKNNRPLANYRPDAKSNQSSRSHTVAQNSKILAGVEEDKELIEIINIENAFADIKGLLASGELDLPDVIENILPDRPPKRGTGMTDEIKNVTNIVEKEGAENITQARTEEECNKALKSYLQKYQEQLVAPYDGDKGGFGDAGKFVKKSKEGVQRLYENKMAHIKAKRREDRASTVLNKKPAKKSSAKKIITPKVAKKATKPIRGDTKLMIEEATILNNIGDLPRTTDLGRLKQTSSSTTSGSVTSPPKPQTQTSSSSGSSGQRKRKSSEPSKAEGARKKYKSAKAKDDIKDALADAIEEIDNEPKLVKRSTRIKNAKQVSLAENPDVTEEEEVPVKTL